MTVKRTSSANTLNRICTFTERLKAPKPITRPGLEVGFTYFYHSKPEVFCQCLCLRKISKRLKILLRSCTALFRSGAAQPLRLRSSYLLERFLWLEMNCAISTIAQIIVAAPTKI